MASPGGPAPPEGQYEGREEGQEIPRERRTRESNLDYFVSNDKLPVLGKYIDSQGERRSSRVNRGDAQRLGLRMNCDKLG